MLRFRLPEWKRAVFARSARQRAAHCSLHKYVCTTVQWTRYCGTVYSHLSLYYLPFILFTRSGGRKGRLARGRGRVWDRRFTYTSVYLYTMYIYICVCACIHIIEGRKEESRKEGKNIIKQERLEEQRTKGKRSKNGRKETNA